MPYNPLYAIYSASKIDMQDVGSRASQVIGCDLSEQNVTV